TGSMPSWRGTTRRTDPPGGRFAYRQGAATACKIALAPGTKLRHTAVMRPVFTAPLALGLIAAVATPVQAATVYVRAGRLVDPEAGKVLERQVL
ncbi:hypothetical protein ABTK80_20125, partial [Acinetobacter baumannii]